MAFDVKLKLSTGPRYSDRTVAIWLLVVAIMVAAMVVIGGITRVTESGLSMVEWRPLLGWFPPLNDKEWGRVFGLYQDSPEYLYVNTWMDLVAFKNIFWWEYIHRLWGRLIGLVFFIPFVWFLVTRSIRNQLLPRVLFLFILGGLQGGIGWWMVKSGLASDPSVSQYRLVIHLGMAFLILGILIWTILDLVGERGDHASKLRIYHAQFALILISITIIAGGLVAGLNAGLIYNTFPLMGGQIFPPDYAQLQPLWRNIFENESAVQFNHRFLATLSVVTILSLLWGATQASVNKHCSLAVYVLSGLVLIQFSLGIVTLTNYVPMSLAVIHQFLGLCLFGAGTWVLWTLRGNPPRK